MVRQPAEVFPVAEFILDEIHARGWALPLLAERGAFALRDLESVMAGGEVTVELAQGLGRALGTSADLWLRIDREWWVGLGQALHQEHERGGP